MPLFFRFSDPYTDFLLYILRSTVPAARYSNCPYPYSDFLYPYTDFLLYLLRSAAHTCCQRLTSCLYASSRKKNDEKKYRTPLRSAGTQGVPLSTREYPRSTREYLRSLARRCAAVRATPLGNKETNIHTRG